VDAILEELSVQLSIINLQKVIREKKDKDEKKANEALKWVTGKINKKLKETLNLKSIDVTKDQAKVDKAIQVFIDGIWHKYDISLTGSLSKSETL
jgi:hypothetical protein